MEVLAADIKRVLSAPALFDISQHIVYNSQRVNLISFYRIGFRLVAEIELKVLQAKCNLPPSPSHVWM